MTSSQTRTLVDLENLELNVNCVCFGSSKIQKKFHNLIFLKKTTPNNFIKCCWFEKFYEGENLRHLNQSQLKC